jgi:hypothetical protein
VWRGMLPLYTTRIEDLGQGDFVKVDWPPAFNVALLAGGAVAAGSNTDQPESHPTSGKAGVLVLGGKS